MVTQTERENLVEYVRDVLCMPSHLHPHISHHLISSPFAPRSNTEANFREITRRDPRNQMCFGSKSKPSEQPTRRSEGGKCQAQSQPQQSWISGAFKSNNKQDSNSGMKGYQPGRYPYVFWFPCLQPLLRISLQHFGSFSFNLQFLFLEVY